MNYRLRYPLLASISLVALAIALLAYRQAVQPVQTLWSQSMTINATVTLATPVANSTLYLSCGATSGATCARENSTPAATNALVSSGANGSFTLDNPSGQKWVTFKSANITSVSSRSSWSVNLNVTSIGSPNPNGSITVWYVSPASGACGTPPASTATNYLAGATVAAFSVGTMSIPLTAGTAATGVPTSNVALCLRVDRATGGQVSISTAGASTLVGPFTP